MAVEYRHIDTIQLTGSTMFQPRMIFVALFLACAALLGFGYYLQYFRDLEPCPLCIFQRVCYALLGLFAVVAAVHDPARRGIRVYAFLVGVAATAGLAFAGRQTWLQHLPPDQVPACGPGLEYWIKTLPIAETIKKVFRGTGECAAVDWTFLRLSIAEWSVLCFSGCLVAAAIVWSRAGDRSTRF
jgi:protein dithiol:quinone oxidoreductase